MSRLEHHTDWQVTLLWIWAMETRTAIDQHQADPGEAARKLWCHLHTEEIDGHFSGYRSPFKA